MTSCASFKPSPDTKIVVIKVDEDLLKCANAPVIPAHEATFGDWMVYIVDLQAAYLDCHLHLDQILKFQQHTVPVDSKNMNG